MAEEDTGRQVEESFPPEPVADPLAAVRAVRLKRHDNLVYVGPVYLHEGWYLRIVATICQVFRHDTWELHHVRLLLDYFKRRRISDWFEPQRQTVVEKGALDMLVRTLRDVPRFASLEECVWQHQFFTSVGAEQAITAWIHW